LPLFNLLDRNITTRQLAWICTVCIFLLSIITQIFLLWVYNLAHHWYIIIAVALIVSLFSYIIIYQTVNFYLYRKIKLIYKNIHSHKTRRGSLREKLKMENINLKSIEQEVENWSKQYETDNIAREKQEAFRREYIGNVSHELKTPVFKIHGYLETLINGALEDDKVNKKFLHKALLHTEKLNVIINDLIQLNKYEDGTLILVKKDFDLYELTLEAIHNLKEMANKKKVNMVFKDGCNQPFFVNADPILIAEVLENLLSNAIKYSPTNKDIVISYYVMDDNILTEIMDFGHGIAADQLSRVFERFYRTDSARTSDVGGSGLGLSICKHIVEAHRQSIHVRSTINKGTTFSFTLKKAEL